MGISDRDYMQSKRGKGIAARREPSGPKATWWKRLWFKLWLLFHGRE